ncbi:MAG: alpha-2-macroglobulin, partial [Chitinophagaceae bacterium]
VSVNLLKLKLPARIFRERLWEPADLQVMDIQTYASLFPHDIYKNENEPSAWEAAGVGLSFKDTTRENGLFSLPPAKIEAGWYRFEAKAKDRSGDTVRLVKYFEVVKNGSLSPNLSATISVEKPVVHKGEKFQYTIETNLDNLFVIRDIESGIDSLNRTYINLNKSREVYNLPVTDNETGGFGIQLAFVKYNRLISAYISIDVPQIDKELNINYSTFRDKTVPGSAEKWKLKITGSNGDKIAAEVLTGMYDASLDQFNPHKYNLPELWPTYFQRSSWEGPTFRQEGSREKPWQRDYVSLNKLYDRLFVDDPENDGIILNMRNGRPGSGGGITVRGLARKETMVGAPMAAQNKAVSGMDQAAQTPVDADSSQASGIGANELPEPSIRKNFNETAFFFPELITDSSGNIEFSFTMPEALTRWKWLTLAHTKNLAFGVSEKTIITQKELMVQPNATRFVRQGDRIDFSGKIINLTDAEMTGQVELLLIDPVTNRSVDGWFKNVFPNQFFTAPAKQSVAVNFSIEIPFQYSKALKYRMVARSGNISDGEEGVLPVLSNRILLTEAIQLPVRGSGIKNFVLDKLIKSEGSETITNHSLTVEYTTNPAWLAIQSLPSLSSTTRESADEIFNSYYATMIAATIMKASPILKDYFAKYKDADTAKLLSDLEKNPELKAILIAETPWVLQGKSETEQKRQLRIMFDVTQSALRQQTGLAKLAAMQSADGAFTWFPGGPNDRYITQYILTGIGHILKLDPQAEDNALLQTIIRGGLDYLDKVIIADYELLVKNTKKGLSPAGGLESPQIQYGYLRSFFRKYTLPGNGLKAYNYYRNQSREGWVKQSRYMQAMIAIALHRTDDIKTANSIVRSLKQNAIVNEELGMYWK